MNLIKIEEKHEYGLLAYIFVFVHLYTQYAMYGMLFYLNSSLLIRIRKTNVGKIRFTESIDF